MSSSFEPTAADPVGTLDDPGPGSKVGTRNAHKAGYWLCGGGIALALSSVLPWVSVDGVDTLHQSGDGVAMLLVVGALLGYFGRRVLRGHVTKAISITLWLLAVVEVFMTVGLFGAESQLSNDGAGIISVQPAIGFYLAIGGFIAGVVGAVLVHCARRRQVASAPPAGQ